MSVSVSCDGLNDYVDFGFTKLIWKLLHITRHNQDSLTCCLQGHVVMGTQAPSVYQQVIEKTKGIMSRTQELARNIEKRLNIDKAGYEVS